MERRSSFALFVAMSSVQAADPDDGCSTWITWMCVSPRTCRICNCALDGEPVLLMRHQDPDHRIDAPYDKTARRCPPYCVQPMQIAPGVETIGELELIDYLKRIDGGDRSILVIDSRTEGLGPARHHPRSSQHFLPAARSGICVAAGDRRDAATGVWRGQCGRDLGLRRREDPGVLLQRCLVRAVTDQYQGPAGVRLSGSPHQVVSRRDAGVGDAGADDPEAGRRTD
jgi:hypothetical protein